MNSAHADKTRGISLDKNTLGAIDSNYNNMTKRDESLQAGTHDNLIFKFTANEFGARN